MNDSTGPLEQLRGGEESGRRGCMGDREKTEKT
jgi:hypothetical protein